MFRGLQHDGVTGDQWSADLSGGEHQGVVEGDDPSDDPKGVAQRVVESSVEPRDRVTTLFEDDAGEIPQEPGRVEGVLSHLANGTAIVGHVEQRELWGILEDHRRELFETCGPFEERRRPPGRKRFGGGSDRVVDVVGPALGESCEEFTIRRIHRFERGATSSVA